MEEEARRVLNVYPSFTLSGLAGQDTQRQYVATEDFTIIEHLADVSLLPEFISELLVLKRQSKSDEENAMEASSKKISVT